MSVTDTVAVAVTALSLTRSVRVAEPCRLLPETAPWNAKVLVILAEGFEVSVIVTVDPEA